MKQVRNLLLSTLLILNFNLFAQDKIVGGDRVTDILETGFAVSLNGCAGSIISSKWILTAAHCETTFAPDSQTGQAKSITFGVLDTSDSSAEKIEIKRHVIHPLYSPWSSSYDFALLELDQEININGTNIQKIKYADAQTVADGLEEAGVDATVYGWGYTRENAGNLEDKIRKVTVPIVTNQTANHRDSYNGMVTDSMLAAGFNAGGKDACQGDSGGPLVSFDSSGDPVLIGVVSWGMGCARAMKYGIYSRVSYVTDWITETITPGN